MISIRTNTDLSIRDVIARSEVANHPDAVEIFSKCVCLSSEVQYGYVDGELACVWGLIPPTLMSETAYLWLLVTDIVAEHKFLLVRHSQRFIEKTLKRYPVIVGTVLRDNHPAKRWLRWLGAEFGQINGNKIDFVIRRKTLNG